MKSIFKLLFLFSLALVGCSEKKSAIEKKKNETLSASSDKNESYDVIIQAQSEPDTITGSMTAVAIGKVGNTSMKITYHSPSVRGRIVWGGLVPFDKVWVTGAHMATSIEFDHDIIVGGKTITTGKYAFFTIPGKDEWTIIINSNWQQHLADQYNEAEDVVRLKVKPEQEEKYQERLRYVVEEESNGEGELVMYWEKVEVSMSFTVK